MSASDPKQTSRWARRRRTRELAFAPADCLLDGVAEAAVVKELELGTACGDEIHPPEMSATTSSVLVLCGRPDA
jgi:hypothetical protein